MQTSIYNKETGLITSQSNPETYVSSITIYFHDRDMITIDDKDWDGNDFLIDYAVDTKTNTIIIWHMTYETIKSEKRKKVCKVEYHYMSYRLKYPNSNYEDKFGKIETR